MASSVVQRMYESIGLVPGSYVFRSFGNRRNAVPMIKPSTCKRTQLCQAASRHSPYSNDDVWLNGLDMSDGKNIEDAALCHQSLCNEVLNEIEMHKGRKVGKVTLERWERCYAALVDEAVEMGIPRSVIPVVGDLSVETLTSCRKHLRGMIASFSSSGL